MAAMDERTRRARADWDDTAATYDRSAGLDRFLIGDSRQRLCREASGRTLEVAIGTGLNLGLYPPDVQLTGVDFSAGMLGVAAQRAAQEVEVDLVHADAQQLPFGDASSTPWSAHSRCALCPTNRRSSPRCIGSWYPVDGCCWSTTSSTRGSR